MATATATKDPGPKHNIEAIRQEYYDRIAQHGMTPLWKVMGNVVTKEPKTRVQPVVWHYDDVKRLVMESGGLITAEEAERRVPDPREPRHARRVEGDQHAVCRRPDDPAGRGRARAPARVVGDPVCARWRGRLHGGRGREVLHVAGRLRHHRQLGAARSRQHVGQADAVARRARLPAGELLRDLVRPAFRERHADHQPRGRQFAGVLRLRRAARQCAGVDQAQPGHQLHLCPHPADHRAHDEGWRHRQAPRCARALRQPDHRWPGPGDHGRQSCHAAEGLQGRAVPQHRRHDLRLRGRAGHHHDRRRGAAMGAERRVRRAAVEALRAQRRRRRRCCSRSPTVRRRKRSASGARTRPPPDVKRTEFNCHRPHRCGRCLFVRDALRSQLFGVIPRRPEGPDPNP